MHSKLGTISQTVFNKISSNLRHLAIFTDGMFVPLLARTRVTISPSVKNGCTSEIRPICFAFLFVGEESFSLSAKGLLPPTFDTATFRVGDSTVRMRSLTTHGIAGLTRVSNFSGVLNNDIKLFKFGGEYREFSSCNVQLVFWLFFFFFQYPIDALLSSEHNWTSMTTLLTKSFLVAT